MVATPRRQTSCIVEKTTFVRVKSKHFKDKTPRVSTNNNTHFDYEADWTPTSPSPRRTDIPPRNIKCAVQSAATHSARRSLESDWMESHSPQGRDQFHATISPNRGGGRYGERNNNTDNSSTPNSHVGGTRTRYSPSQRQRIANILSHEESPASIPLSSSRSLESCRAQRSILDTEEEDEVELEEGDALSSSETRRQRARKEPRGGIPPRQPSMKEAASTKPKTKISRRLIQRKRKKKINRLVGTVLSSMSFASESESEMSAFEADPNIIVSDASPVSFDEVDKLSSRLEIMIEDDDVYTLAVQAASESRDENETLGCRSYLSESSSIAGPERYATKASERTDPRDTTRWAVERSHDEADISEAGEISMMESQEEVECRLQPLACTKVEKTLSGLDPDWGSDGNQEPDWEVAESAPIERPDETGLESSAAAGGSQVRNVGYNASMNEPGLSQASSKDQKSTTSSALSSNMSKNDASATSAITNTSSKLRGSRPPLWKNIPRATTSKQKLEAVSEKIAATATPSGTFCSAAPVSIKENCTKESFPKFVVSPKQNTAEAASYTQESLETMQSMSKESIESNGSRPPVQMIHTLSPPVSSMDVTEGNRREQSNKSVLESSASGTPTGAAGKTLTVDSLLTLSLDTTTEEVSVPNTGTVGLADADVQKKPKRRFWNLGKGATKAKPKSNALLDDLFDVEIADVDTGKTLNKDTKMTRDLNLKAEVDTVAKTSMLGSSMKMNEVSTKGNLDLVQAHNTESMSTFCNTVLEESNGKRDEGCIVTGKNPALAPKAKNRFALFKKRNTKNEDSQWPSSDIRNGKRLRCSTSEKSTDMDVDICTPSSIGEKQMFTAVVEGAGNSDKFLSSFDSNTAAFHEKRKGSNVEGQTTTKSTPISQNFSNKQDYQTNGSQEGTAKENRPAELAASCNDLAVEMMSPNSSLNSIDSNASVAGSVLHFFNMGGEEESQPKAPTNPKQRLVGVASKTHRKCGSGEIEAQKVDEQGIHKKTPLASPAAASNSVQSSLTLTPASTIKVLRTMKSPKEEKIASLQRKFREKPKKKWSKLLRRTRAEIVKPVDPPTPQESTEIAVPEDSGFIQQLPIEFCDDNILDDHADGPANPMPLVSQTWQPPHQTELGIDHNKGGHGSIGTNPEEDADEGDDVSREERRDSFVIKGMEAAVPKKTSKWSRFVRFRSKTKPRVNASSAVSHGHQSSIMTSFNECERVQTFEPEHIVGSRFDLENLVDLSVKSAAGDFDGASFAMNIDHRPVGRGKEEVQPVVSDLSNDSLGEVEDALAILRRHAKRLGVNETDLIKAVKSEESMQNQDDDHLDFGDEIWDAVTNYFKGR